MSFAIRFLHFIVWNLEILDNFFAGFLSKDIVFLALLFMLFLGREERITVITEISVTVLSGGTQRRFRQRQSGEKIIFS